MPVDKHIAISAILLINMDMKQWRKLNKLSMAEAAKLMSLENARAYQRYETGENRPDAPLVERIRAVTDGSVTAEDHHRQRLDWLKANRPELVAGCLEVSAWRKTANDR